MRTDQAPLVSITFPTMNRRDLVESVVADIRRELADVPYEIVIVAGPSQKDAWAYLRAQRDIVAVDEGEPGGCRRAFDLGFRACRGEFVCWLNDDVSITPGALRAMLDFMRAPENADVGVGAFPASASGAEPQHFVLNTFGFPPAPFADMGMLRRETLERVGYLDGRYRRFGWDPDLSLKIWDMGLRVRLCPQATIVHYFYDDANRRSMEFLRGGDTGTLERTWSGRLSALAGRAWTPEMVRESWSFLLPRSRAYVRLHLGDEPGLMAVLRDVPAGELADWLADLYRVGLEAQRGGDVDTPRLAYRAVCALGEANPGVAAWAHFKLGELLRDAGDLPAARDSWLRALALKPDLEKARVHLAAPEKPLCAVFGEGDGAPEGGVSLGADPGDDFAWEYLFDQRKPDAVLFGASRLDGVEDGLSNALRYLSREGAVLTAAPGGPLSASVGDIRRLTTTYAPEFHRWRDALKCGWLLAKAPQGVNERDVEWPWVLERAAQGARGALLDVGSYQTPIPAKLARLGYNVTALDINPPADPGGIRVVQGDIRGTGFPDAGFAAISCISTLEHIGLPGRYGIIAEDDEGDFAAVAEMLRLLAPGGTLWVTVPVGRRDVPPINRCYGAERLARLFKGAVLRDAQYQVLGRDGVWRACGEDEAVATDWYAAPWYALGLFELGKE